MSTRFLSSRVFAWSLGLLLCAACGGSGDSSEAGAGGSSSGGSSAGTSASGGSTTGGNGGQGNSGGQASGAGGSASGGSASGGSGSGGSGGLTGTSGQAGAEQAGADQAGAGGSEAGGSDAGGDAGAGGGDAGAGGSDAGAGGSSAGAAGAAGCSPACVDPQVCSKAGSCIDAGTCLVDGDCGGGLLCNPETKVCEPGSSCGVTKISAEQKQPNLLLVLDRSCSMNGYKWQTAVASLNKLTTLYKDKIRFGLILFPDIVKPNCEQDGGPIVPIAPGADVQIQDLLTKALGKQDPYFPDGPCVTNIDTGMDQASKDPALADKERKSFVLLMTDGAQAGCNVAGGDKGTEQIITNLSTLGVGTFALGFSKSVDQAQMNKFAALGGYPDPDPVRDFYLAEDEASLDAALTAIAKQTLGCDYALQSDPPDPSGIYVFFDKTNQIPKDTNHQDGWDYDPATKTVTFHGPACQALQSGSVTALDIVFGCADEKIPPPDGCESGLGCDVEHPCPSDPKLGAGFCEAGCCVFGKFLSNQGAARAFL